MIKAVIFDIDNTLIDFLERKLTVIKESVKAMIDAGLKEDYSSLLKEFTDFYWKNGIENQKIFELFLKTKYKVIDYRVLAYAIIAYRRTNDGLLRPYPGTKAVLIALKEKGYKLGVLSDAPKLQAYTRLCSLGLDNFFDAILTKSDVKFLKPNKKGFKMIANRLGVQLEECIMIGDKITKDISGAKSLGMKTIFAKYGYVEGDEPKTNLEADFIANDITDIPSILDKLR